MLLLEPTTSWTREPERPEPVPESLVGGYRIRRRIAEGGDRVIYEAHEEESGRTVALEVAGGASGCRWWRASLRPGVESLAALRHPSITHPRAAEDLLSLERVRGVALTVWQRCYRQPLGRRELRRRIHLFRRICRAVAYAHRNGVVHLDLKPATILIDAGPHDAEAEATAEGAVQLLDFGLVRQPPEGAGDRQETGRRKKVRGTLAYMSPEQAHGLRRLDARTDVYALGVIFYEMLTGRLPLELDPGEPQEALRTLRRQAPRRPSSLDRRLAGYLELILLRALAKDPHERYATAGELLAEVDRFLAGRPIRRAYTSGLRRLLRRPEAAYRLMWITFALGSASTLLLSLASRYGLIGG